MSEPIVLSIPLLGILFINCSSLSTFRLPLQISKKKKRADSSRHARRRAYPCRHARHALILYVLGFLFNCAKNILPYLKARFFSTKYSSTLFHDSGEGCFSFVG